VDSDTVFVVLWLLLMFAIVITPAGVTARIAQRKGLNPWAWFAFGLVLPWAPLFMVIAKRRKDDKPRRVSCTQCGVPQRISPLHQSYQCVQCSHVNEVPGA
jgi:hypothetical protein